VKDDTIFRVVKNKHNPYVMIAKDVINDPSLSMKATAVLVYILSKPDHWQVYLKDVVKHFKDGRDAVANAIKELESEGYLKKSRRRLPNGQFKGWKYEIYESPLNPGTFTETGFSEFGKPDASNNNLKQNPQFPLTWYDRNILQRIQYDSA